MYFYYVYYLLCVYGIYYILCTAGDGMVSTPQVAAVVFLQASAFL